MQWQPYAYTGNSLLFSAAMGDKQILRYIGATKVFTTALVEHPKLGISLSCRQGSLLSMTVSESVSNVTTIQQRATIFCGSHIRAKRECSSPKLAECWWYQVFSE